MDTSDPKEKKVRRNNSDVSRRRFLKEMSAIPVVAMAGGLGLPALASDLPLPEKAPLPPLPKGKKLVAIQIGARSFVDEGVDGCLETLQEKAGVNTLMSAVFSYGRGLEGRQVPGQPLPDHGVHAYDKIHGGSYTKVHPEYYANSVIKDIRAPELGKFDIFADVIPKAKARGIQTYALFEEVYNPRLMPNFEKVAEVDLYGRIGRSTCLNNPYARNFLVSMVSDWFSNNDLDGMMWESERQGPLNNTVGAFFWRFQKNAPIYCFCHYCRAKARARGIDVWRAREGYLALQKWVNETVGQPRSIDGAFVRFWRVLFEYPEIMAWERLWYEAQNEVYALLYGTVKGITPRAQVGWHIMHLITMSPFYRAEVDYGRMAHYADFIKPSTYNNCAGPRFAHYIRNAQSAVYRDSTPEEVLNLHYRMLGYKDEATLAELPTTGLSARTVGDEARRALADVQGKARIYPGIDIDIPTPLDDKRTTPADVKASVLAAFHAGAQGVVLSRKYAEMKLTNLAGAGEALRELKIG